jgi:hypothetical protein
MTPYSVVRGCQHFGGAYWLPEDEGVMQLWNILPDIMFRLHDCVSEIRHNIGERHWVGTHRGCASLG